MKKYLAILAALALVLSMCLAAFAESGGLNPGDVTNPSNPPEPSINQEPTVPSSPPIPIEPEDPPATQPTQPDPPSSEPAQPDPPSSEPVQPDPPSSEPVQPEPSTEPTVPTWTEAPTNPPTNPPTWRPTTPPATGLPKVTKSPSAETVKEGGYAEFVARADNCTSIIWHLQNPGGSTDILAKDAPARFPGLIVTGLESERLGLNQIPKGLDQWRVRAEFVGSSGNVWSEAAVITVINQELAAPTIESQPGNLTLNAGEKGTLRVTALTSEPNTNLTYQWYKNTINSNVGGKAILGATSDSYTPEAAQGTTYYYCAVRCTNGSDISVATKTACAAVTVNAVGGEYTTIGTVPTEPTSAATLVPWGTGETETTMETMPPVTPAPTRSNTLLVIVVAVIVVISVLGIGATVLILKVYGGQDDYERPVEAPKPERRPRQEPKKQPEPRKQPQREPELDLDFTGNDDEWDDLSDLGDLSIYFDDEDLNF